MINPIRAWNRFFFGLVSAKPLGATRIFYGLIALANLGFCAVDLDYWYTDTGLLRGDEAWVMAGPTQPSLLHFYQDPATVRVWFVMVATFAAFFTIGLRTRLMGILYYFGMLMIHNRNLVSSSGADVLLLICGFNLMLSPCGAAYSVDAWLESRKRGTSASPVVLPWALRLIQIQVAVVYMGASIIKAGGVTWLNGTALHFVFNNTEVTRFDLTFLNEYPVIINAMTYMALAMEFTLAFFLWFRACRPFVIYVGFLLHAGILYTINIPCFGELMWVGYLSFLTPPEWDGLVRAIDVRRLFRKERGAAEAPVEAESPTPVFRPSSILVRIDAGGAFAGPHAILATASRPLEPALGRNSD